MFVGALEDKTLEMEHCSSLNITLEILYCKYLGTCHDSHGQGQYNVEIDK